MSKIQTVIIAVNGIYTGSENWTDAFRRWVSQSSYNGVVAVEEYDFGKLFALQMYAIGLVPFLGARRQKGFAEWFRKIMKQYPPETKYSFVSHSFGTWMTHALLDKNPKIKPRTVVLFGSVLSHYFQKTKFPNMFGRGQLKKLVVYWSPKDTIIGKRLVEIPPFGRLGAKGFVQGAQGLKVEEFETDETHSSYWSPSKRDHYFEEIAKHCSV